LCGSFLLGLHLLQALCIQKDDTECVKLLLKHSADVNAPLKEKCGGVSALYVCAVRGNMECTKVLLCAGANRLAAVDAGATAVHVAAQNGHAAVLRLLINADPSSTESDSTALAENKFVKFTPDEIKNLIAATMKNGVSATYLAAQNGKRDCLAVLLDANADVHSAVPDGSTCLHAAVQGGHTDCVQLLLQRGGDLTKESSQGVTPLHAAAMAGKQDCVKAMLAHLAETHSADGDQSKYRAAVDASMKQGESALHLAAGIGNHQCASMLIAAKADVNKKTSQGRTPLLLACLKGQPVCVRMLLAHGADTECELQTGERALHLATSANNHECVDALLHAQANPSHPNKNGCTALHTAALHGYHEVCMLRYAHGLSPVQHNC
jgi:ankyrin repeat protein